MTWFEAAMLCERVYGSLVNYEYDDRFFICPECKELLFEGDWEDHNFEICPICEFDFLNEEC